MNKAKALMRQTHSQSQPLTQSLVQTTVKSVPETPRPPAPPAQPKAAAKPASLPTGVMQIARDDVDIKDYGIKAVATNFNCYNKEVFKWLKDFSSNNQFNGGAPITKSQVIEIMLDVMMYDLGINPIGYTSQQALREDIQNKIKGI